MSQGIPLLCVEISFLGNVASKTVYIFGQIKKQTKLAKLINKLCKLVKSSFGFFSHMQQHHSPMATSVCVPLGTWRKCYQSLSSTSWLQNTWTWQRLSSLMNPCTTVLETWKIPQLRGAKQYLRSGFPRLPCHQPGRIWWIACKNWRWGRLPNALKPSSANSQY